MSDSDRSEKVPTFASLRNPGYRRLWRAGMLSSTSLAVQFLLRGVLVWDLTERDGAIGLTFLLLGIGILICTPLGGVASDRYSKRLILLICEGTLLFSSLAIGTAVLLGREQFWMLLVTSALHGAGIGFAGPTRMAFVVELGGREQLGNAISLFRLSMSGTRIAGPLLAAALVRPHLLGIGGTYLVAGAITAVGFLLTFGLPNGTAASVDGRRNPFVEIVDGVRYVNSIPELKRIVITTFLVILIAFNYSSFIPALVEDTYGLPDLWVGILSSATAVGAVLVSIPLASRADSPKAPQVMLASGVVFSICIIGFGLSPNIWWALVCVILIGIGSTAFQTLSNTIALQISDDAHKGRVQSLLQMAFAGFGIAAFPLGILAESIGRRQTIVVIGCVATLVTVLLGVLTARDGQNGEPLAPLPSARVPSVEDDYAPSL